MITLFTFIIMHAENENVNCESPTKFKIKIYYCSSYILVKFIPSDETNVLII